MIVPLHDNVLVRPIQNSDTSKGGVYMGMAKTTFTQATGKKVQNTVGEVLAVGKGKDRKRGRRAPDAPIGSIVCFSDTCGVEVEHEGEKLKFIREGDIAFFMDKPDTVEVVYRDS
jgi:co-chaperonin GroES (HSP10)